MKPDDGQRPYVETFDSVQPSTSAARRSRGHRAGLNQEKIIAAARQLPQHTLSMQAVANELGVDRKALNHYVHDRETLLSLVAAAEFNDAFVEITPDPNASWRDTVTIYARNCITAMQATGYLTDHLKLDVSTSPAFFKSMEKVMDTLVTTGLPVTKAGKASKLICDYCLTYAREERRTHGAADSEGEAESLDMLRRRALKKSIDDGLREEFPLLAEALDSCEQQEQENQTQDGQGAGRTQWGLKVILDGIAAQLN